jgi:hypothetical protein
MIQDCKVCLAPHDEEIHAATDRVLGWFRAQVTEYLHDATDEPMPSEGEELGASQLTTA